MNKQILTILATVICLTFVGGILAETTLLDNANSMCLGTDCENSSANGTVTIDNCRSKLHMDIDLSGLTPGNYQLSLQTYNGDTRLNLACMNPNAPMNENTNAWECGNWQGYSFYNFDMNAVTTDGNFQNSYEVNLPEGYYPVILLVKHDISNGVGGASYPIVLQKDHVTFSISNSCIEQFQDRVIALEGRMTALELKGCINGTDGVNGKSAYQIWLDLNNTGSDDYFIQSLKGVKGDKGDTGEQGISGIGINGTTPIFGVDYFNGSDGYTPIAGKDYFNGSQGSQGPQGPQGIDGTNATVDLTSINNNISYFDSVFKALFKYVPGFNLFYHNPPVATENCVTKANDYFCDYRNYSNRKDYYGCQAGQGTATSCNVGKCSYITGHILCNSCNVNTGKC